MSPVEIIALAFAVLISVKLIVIFIKPKIWYDLTIKKIFTANKIITQTVITIMAGVILFYLLAEITIVQIFAAMVFAWMLVLLTFDSYREKMKEFAESVYEEEDVLEKGLFSIVIWIALLVWVLYSIFA